MRRNIIYFISFLMLVIAISGCSGAASTSTTEGLHDIESEEIMDETTSEELVVERNESVKEIDSHDVNDESVVNLEDITDIESNDNSEESATNPEDIDANKSTPETFVSSGTSKALTGFLDFRKTNFSITVPDNKDSIIMPGMTEGSVCISDRTDEIPSCNATILYETDGKYIHQITVLSPDDVTLDPVKIKELISTIIVQMGITDMEHATMMVDSAYEAGEPIVDNNTYLHLNRLDCGFMIKY